ncbi:hypothetical protein C2S52_000953 [Perilla frutescens var. hirtella]|nr:hypothetical protein C2S52_000953 [Perilla frutescens var. hirtella]
MPTRPPEGERIPLDPDDEELLLDDDCPPNAVAADDMKWEGSPSGKYFPCLVKSPDLSPSEAEKQAKRLPEYQVPNSSAYLDKRERNIQVILDSFEACKSLPGRIAYGANLELKPRRFQPLFPCFDWAGDQSVVVKLSTVPNAGPEMHESRCVQSKPGALGRTYCIGSSSKPPLNEVEARNAGAISSKIGSQMPACGIVQDTLAQDTAGADDDNMSG